MAKELLTKYQNNSRIIRLTMSYAELHCVTNFTFLRGASRPEELVETAARLGYQAIAITDECSLAGVVKAHVKAREMAEEGFPVKLIIGSEFSLPDNSKLVALVNDKLAYEELSAFISLCRRRSAKGEYQLNINDLDIHLQHCLLIWIPCHEKSSRQLQSLLNNHRHVWIGYQRLLLADDEDRYQLCFRHATLLNKPMVACGNVHMHSPRRKILQDTLTAIRLNKTINELGEDLLQNSENHLKPVHRIARQYPEALLRETLNIADRCYFSLDEIRYQYPEELVPPQQTPIIHLTQLVEEGARKRWSNKVPFDMREQIAKELSLIEKLRYEYYFLTVHDIVRFARSQNILCQGRGSAANSVVCYCLFITEVDPTRISLLFERFISQERNEPPDIDVDFEHERREEVIQYIYKKYTRERAALAATVITYRSRSAIRDVGKALGLNSQFTDQLSRSLGWWHKPDELEAQFKKQLQSRQLRGQSPRGRSRHSLANNHFDSDSHQLRGQSPLMQNSIATENDLSSLKGSDPTASDPSVPDTSIAQLFMQLIREIMGFPRHLSQHVGGFIISNGPLSRLVPVENASMPDRTVIQWDKEDIEALGLLKVDVLGLGMLSAIRKMLEFVNDYNINLFKKDPITIADVPDNDVPSYNLLCNADSVGIFQVESRAQMSMLPRLKPREFYDLVIQVAIVRPGPIQGNMVHPFLRRRDKTEPVSYENEAVREVLERTLGVPIFQEQVIKLAMVAAGFSGGEADRLRRAMASWGKNGNLLQFREKLLEGMLTRGYSRDFAGRLFEQMKGFGSYGFPESHAASFALLVYVSAWFKCHHPAAFYAAIINSLPMGFYSPSQLIQDARRHDIKVLPIDVQHSNWDCTLEWGKISSIPSPSLRLGLRLVKGLSKETAGRIELARYQNSFTDLNDLINRAKLDQLDRQALIRANATASLSGNRHQSHWQNLAVHQPGGQSPWGRSRHSLTNNHFDSNSYKSQISCDKDSDPSIHDPTDSDPSIDREDLNDNIILSSPSEIQDIRADYRYTGLTLRRHPMLVLRNKPLFKRCKRCIDLQPLEHKRFVQVAGIVTGRQRPGTATGVIFLTLEDETGNINVVIWKDRQQQNREVLLKSKLLLVKGVLERKDQVIHVIAGQLVDCSHYLEAFLLPSRDFH